MSTKASVTTPGGFFIGLGGIVSFCIVAALISYWVKTRGSSDELRPQQIAVGLLPAADAKGDDIKKKNEETKALLAAAEKAYNGKKPDIGNLDDLRGVVRYREAQKIAADSAKALVAPLAWKDQAKGEVTMPVELAMKVVASGLKDRKPKASAVKLDLMPPADPKAPPTLPNVMGGGTKTMIFSAPSPAPEPAPSAQPAAAPANPSPAPNTGAITPENSKAPHAIRATTAATMPARPAILNWPDSEK